MLGRDRLGAHLALSPGAAAPAAGRAPAAGGGHGPGQASQVRAGTRRPAPTRRSLGHRPLVRGRRRPRFRRCRAGLRAAPGRTGAGPTGPVMSGPPPGPPPGRPGCRRAAAAGRGAGAGSPRPAPGPAHVVGRAAPRRSAPRAPACPPASGAARRAGVAVRVQRPADRADQDRHVPAADAVTGRELGGPMSGSVTQLPWPVRLRRRVRRRPASSGRRPICSRTGAGAAASVMPSTTTSVTSGAAPCTAPSMASCTVTVEDGQPWQLPSSRSRATPSVTPRYCTPPACEPR